MPEQDDVLSAPEPLAPRPSLTPRWKKTLVDHDVILPAPIVHENLVVALAGDRVTAVTRSDGHVAWHVSVTPGRTSGLLQADPRGIVVATSPTPDQTMLKHVDWDGALVWERRVNGAVMSEGLATGDEKVALLTCTSDLTYSLVIVNQESASATTLRVLQGADFLNHWAGAWWFGSIAVGNDQVGLCCVRDRQMESVLHGPVGRIATTDVALLAVCDGVEGSRAVVMDASQRTLWEQSCLPSMGAIDMDSVALLEHRGRTREAVVLRDAATGKRLWTANVPPETIETVLHDGCVLTRDIDGICLWARDNGALIGRIQSGLGMFLEGSAVAGGDVVVALRGDLMVFEFPTQ